MTPHTRNFLLGVLSEAENKTIADGVHEVVMDHLEDVVDRDGTAELVLRSGATGRGQQLDRQLHRLSEQR